MHKMSLSETFTCYTGMSKDAVAMVLVAHRLNRISGTYGEQAHVII